MLLLDAINQMNFQEVEQAINEGQDVDILHKIDTFHSKSIKLLVKCGANINKQDRIHNSILSNFCKLGGVGSIELLIDLGADVNLRDEVFGRTPLLHTCTGGNLETIKILLNSGASLNDIDNNESNALLLACQSGCLEIVTFLLNNDFSQNITSLDGNTPLINAVKSKNIKVVELLDNSTINHKNNLGETALHFAVLNKNTNIAKLLIKRGADVNIKDNLGNTPLMFGCLRLRMLNLLLCNNADINLINNKGTTVFMNAIQRRSVKSIFKLLNEGCAINTRANDGTTPLILASKHWCTCSDCRVTFKKFIDLDDLKMNVKDNNGWDALIHMANRGTPKMLKMILNKRINVDSI